jgi:isoleucyl-tRNA synthetase
VIVETQGEKTALESLVGEVMEEINVKQIVVLGEASARKGFSSELPDYSVASDAKYWVAINTALPPELVAEGVSRELVRHLQNMRRNAKFNITDHIITYYQTKEPLIRQVIDDFADYIKQETLSRELLDSLPPDGAYSEEYRISSKDVSLAIIKTNPKQV